MGLFIRPRYTKWVWTLVQFTALIVDDTYSPSSTSFHHDPSFHPAVPSLVSWDCGPCGAYQCSILWPPTWRKNMRKTIFKSTNINLSTYFFYCADLYIVLTATSQMTMKDIATLQVCLKNMGVREKRKYITLFKPIPFSNAFTLLFNLSLSSVSKDLSPVTTAQCPLYRWGRAGCSLTGRLAAVSPTSTDWTD